MVVGVPREIKVGEQRVALTPAGARAFSEAGHRVLVEAGAGAGSGFRDEEYTQAGAETGDVGAVWSQSELVLKVKEPLAEEIPRIREGQTLFTYLHLAPVPDLVRALQARGVLAIAYETVERADGSLPLLTPMSEVAGRLAVQEGVHYLGGAYGGRGILLSGVPGVPRGNVIILGAGTVGITTFALTNATLPYALELARKGPLTAVRESAELARGVNVWSGRVVYPAVAAAVGEPALALADLS
jgi:alanine dehydrogenase